MSVGLYGKHPSAGDFLRHNCGGALGRELDTWLASSVLAAQQRFGSQWSTRFADLDPSPFLFAPPRSARCLYGVLVNSSDTPGREFPLLVFAELDRSVVSGRAAALPLVPFLGQVIGLLKRRDALTRDELLGEVARLSAPSAADFEGGMQHFRTFCSSTSIGWVYGELFGHGNPDLWARAAKTAQQSSGGGSYGLRCPVGSQPSWHAALWLGLVDSAAPSGFVANAMWNRTTQLVYPGAPHKAAFAALMQHDLDDDSLYDLKKVTPAPANRPIAAEQALSALLSPL